VELTVEKIDVEGEAVELDECVKLN